MFPLRRALPAGALSLAAACAPDDVVRPGAAEPARVALTLTKSGPLASLGDSASVWSRVLDADGRPVDGVPLRWSVRQTGTVLHAEGNGVFRAVGNGRATVVAELDPGTTGVRPAGYWAAPIVDSVVIDVRQRAARLTIAPVDTAFGTLGAARQLRVLVTDARGNALLDGPPPLAWRSADPAVLTVDAEGLVRSRAEGAARVTVHAEELTGAATFTVSPRRPHTSCMVFALRRQTKQSCVTVDFVMREQREGAR